jgi:hypothetical protein
MPDLFSCRTVASLAPKKNKSAPTKLRLEIGHVLFIDVVGYLKLLLKQPSERLRESNEIVSSTNYFARTWKLAR